MYPYLFLAIYSFLISSSLCAQSEGQCPLTQDQGFHLNLKVKEQFDKTYPGDWKIVGKRWGCYRALRDDYIELKKMALYYLFKDWKHDDEACRLYFDYLAKAKKRIDQIEIVNQGGCVAQCTQLYCKVEPQVASELGKGLLKNLPVNSEIKKEVKEDAKEESHDLSDGQIDPNSKEEKNTFPEGKESAKAIAKKAMEQAYQIYLSAEKVPEKYKTAAKKWHEDQSIQEKILQQYTSENEQQLKQFPNIDKNKLFLRQRDRLATELLKRFTPAPPKAPADEKSSSLEIKKIEEREVALIRKLEGLPPTPSPKETKASGEKKAKPFNFYAVGGQTVEGTETQEGTAQQQEDKSEEQETKSDEAILPAIDRNAIKEKRIVAIEARAQKKDENKYFDNRGIDDLLLAYKVKQDQSKNIPLREFIDDKKLLLADQKKYQGMTLAQMKKEAKIQVDSSEKKGFLSFLQNKKGDADDYLRWQLAMLEKHPERDKFRLRLKMRPNGQYHWELVEFNAQTKKIRTDQSDEWVELEPGEKLFHLEAFDLIKWRKSTSEIKADLEKLVDYRDPKIKDCVDCMNTGPLKNAGPMTADQMQLALTVGKNMKVLDKKGPSPEQEKSKY